MVLGAGSVPDVATASAALDAGAAFLVGPNGDPAVAALCADRGMGYVPGTLDAHRDGGRALVGLRVNQALPRLVGRWARVRQGRPRSLPDLQLMATGGIGTADVRAYLAAGAAGVGMGSELVRKDWVRSGDGASLAAAMRAVLADATGAGA